MLTQDDLCEFFIGTLESFSRMASVFPPLATILASILESLKKICFISQLALKEEQKSPGKFKAEVAFFREITFHEIKVSITNGFSQSNMDQIRFFSESLV